MEKAIELIKRHEGLRLKPYEDSVGKISIGYGRNLDDQGITKAEAERMLKADVETAYHDANKFPWFADMNGARRAAILNMLYNLGLPRFLGFKKTINLLDRGEYTEASKEMLRGSRKGTKSLWYKQVGKRAEEVSEMLGTGNWPLEKGKYIGLKD